MVIKNCLLCMFVVALEVMVQKFCIPSAVSGGEAVCLNVQLDTKHFGSLALNVFWVGNHRWKVGGTVVASSDDPHLMSLCLGSMLPCLPWTPASPRATLGMSDH
jgi:hypothetical protein